MANFTDDLYTKWLPKEKWWHKQRWQVTKEFRFYLHDPAIHGTENNKFSIINKGTITDLASIPVMLRWLVPKVGMDSQGAIVHDDIYQNGYMWIEQGDEISKVVVSQKTADDAYYEAMRVLKTLKVRREAIYNGLRLGGFVVWNRYRDKDPA